MNRFLIFLLLSIFCILNLKFYAAETDSLKTYHLQDSIIVVADRYQVSLQSVTNSMDILPVKTNAALASHSVLQVVDMLSPSAFVLDKKIMGYGVGTAGAGSINMRGMGGKPNSGVLVLINGRPDFMGIFGHPLPDVYGLDGIEKVEVVKGPSSAVFGSNAMAGIINLITDPPVSNMMQINMQGGSYNSYIQNGRIDLIRGKTSFRGLFSHKSSDGHVDLSGFNGWNFSTRIDQKLARGWQFSLEGKYVPYRFDDPSMGEDVAGLGSYGAIRRGMADATLTGNTGKLKNSFHLYTNLGHHRFSDGFESHDFSYGFSSYQNYGFSDHLQLGFGMDAIRYGGKAKNTVFPMAPPWPDLHIINSLGGYAVGFYTPHPRLTVKGGLRYQYTSLGIEKLTPTAGISYLPTNFLKVFANFNEGFRVPTLQELYLFPTSNGSLGAEEVKSYEIGSAVYSNNRNSLRLSCFRNRIDNIIQTIFIPGQIPPYRFANSGSASQWGMESSASLQPFRFLSVQLSYSYLEPDGLTALNPQNLFKYFVSTNWRKLKIAFYGKYVGKLYAENYSIAKLDNYHIMNVSLSYPLRYLSLNFHLQNILDKKYEVLPDYAAPGFHFMAGISLNREIF